MMTINISLPDEVAAFVETEMARVGYGSASEYLCALIRNAQMRRTSEAVEAELLESGAQAHSIDTGGFDMEPGLRRWRFGPAGR